MLRIFLVAPYICFILDFFILKNTIQICTKIKWMLHLSMLHFTKSHEQRLDVFCSVHLTDKEIDYCTILQYFKVPETIRFFTYLK